MSTRGVATHSTEGQALRSVEEYLIVDSRRRSVRLYFRSADGFFIFDRDSIAGNIHLQSIDLTIAIDEVYTPHTMHHSG